MRDSREESSVQTIGTIEANEIAHRRRDKSASARHTHVDVGIGNNSTAVAIDDFAVDGWNDD